MADRQISLGTTDVTLTVRLRDATNGSPKTGLTITNLQIRYIRVETDNDVTISAWQSLSTLAGLAASHSDNGGYEIGEGYYRIDIPDAFCASGADFAVLLVRDSVNNAILIKQVEVELSAAQSSSDRITRAWCAGDWRLKSGETNIYELLDADDGSTVILEMLLSNTTPYRTMTLKI